MLGVMGRRFKLWWSGNGDGEEELSAKVMEV